jgi:hypothetical protein
MSNEQQIIKDLIKSKPKHYSKMVQNNPELWNWVLANSTSSDESVPAKIYSAITGTSGACPNGNQHRYKGPSVGWGSCGPVSTCQCVKASIALNVSKSKANRSQEDIERENKKREETNKKKYGVTNTGQTKKARENHKAFYNDQDKVAVQVAKGEQTMLTKYGVTNAAYLDSAIEKSKNTNLAKYGFENAMQNPEISTLAGQRRKELWDPTELLKRNYHRFVDKCARVWRVQPLVSEEQFKGVSDTGSLDWQCLDCGHTYNQRFHWGRPPVCRVCNPPEVKFESQEEISLRDFIKSVYSGPMVVRDRSLINPYELDIVLPEIGIAIDYGGLYWHSEKASEKRDRPKKWNYHETKMNLAESVGLRLLTIFSDEWLTKRPQVESALRNILGINQTKIGARECQVQKVTRQTAIAFHNQHHLQGAALRSPINYGLFYKNTLVSVISFSTNTEGHYLTRYSSSKRVVGGCSKLIKYVGKLEKIKNITTYADLRWSQGKMYYSMGFQEISRVPPTYDYVGTGYSERFESRTLAKEILGNNHTTNQWERLQELGYDRIWDCGKIKFNLSVESVSEDTSPLDLFVW